MIALVQSPRECALSDSGGDSAPAPQAVPRFQGQQALCSGPWP